MTAFSVEVDITTLIDDFKLTLFFLATADWLMGWELSQLNVSERPTETNQYLSKTQSKKETSLRQFN